MMRTRPAWIGLLIVFLASGCALFGGDVPCETDADCGDGQVCGDDAFCVEDPGSPGTDAGDQTDAGGVSDAGVSHDAASADSAGQDSAQPDGAGPDGAGPDAASADGASSDAAQPDAGSGGPCENPPCALMPDSLTAYCLDDNTNPADPCPATDHELYGQDGNLVILAPQYDSSNPGVVDDLITDLTWEQIVVTATGDKDEAETYCADLDLGGHSDWRLPSFRELTTLLDWGSVDPAMDTIHFPAPPRGNFWSSSGHLGFTWMHDFYGSAPSIEIDSQYSIDHHVRCVRGEPHVGGDLRFSLGTWTDRRSGMVWDNDHVPDLSMQEALIYCAELDKGGYSDWRVPNLKELETLIDRTDSTEPKSYAPMDTATGSHEYWTSTPNIHNYGFWVIFFNDGDYGYRYTSGSSFRYLRCVRGP